MICLQEIEILLLRSLCTFFLLQKVQQCCPKHLSCLELIKPKLRQLPQANTTEETLPRSMLEYSLYMKEFI